MLDGVIYYYNVMQVLCESCLFCLSLYITDLTSIPERVESVLDLAAEELRTSIRHIGKITGQVGIEEILDVIFKDFCIGK